MNFSAPTAARKWSYRRKACGIRTLPIIATALALLLTTSVFAVAVPLPRPRPPGAPHAVPPVAADQAPPAAEAAVQPKPPEPSACRLALTDAIAVAPSVPSVVGPGGCGGDDLVRLEAVVLPDARRVAVKPAAILRCMMATAIANWVREDAAPLLAGLGTEMTELDNFDSFECRGRNRVKGAKLSEHGKANALDVRGFKLADGTVLSLTDRTVARTTREKVLMSVCSRFSTVLGPGSDWYHEDHIHLDLAERRNNYKICQWGVDDPSPKVAPLMPVERPQDAPPREAAEKAPEPAVSEPAASDAAEEPARAKSGKRGAR
ncbi:extensin family protein [Afipia sp. Root123D2]|uniref:extensin-like domain-containing protein n=1 Tax=Afipia sp. Root123D2 TaxID=1736436 RepID=UPI0009EC897D|nr:extensin family protein [Afipia sp. Root123D2]